MSIKWLCMYSRILCVIVYAVLRKNIMRYFIYHIIPVDYSIGRKDWDLSLFGPVC